MAYSSTRLMSSPSCVGKLPLRSLLSKFLREGCRSRRSWGNGDRRRRRQARRASSPYRTATLLTLPPPILPRLGGGGCRGAAAHRYSSSASSPSCVGAAGQALVVKPPARGAPEHEEGWRGVPMGASDPRRAADARCAPPLRDATTLRHHTYETPPSVPSQLRSPNPFKQVRQNSWCMVHGGRGNGAYRVVPL